MINLKFDFSSIEVEVEDDLVFTQSCLVPLAVVLLLVLATLHTTSVTVVHRSFPWDSIRLVVALPAVHFCPLFTTTTSSRTQW